ncbi:MAG: D-alanyl-D-alanine carboxypeptidase family protein [Pseudanabaenaceae cyanobacterium bins.68]|nr:D-alanyl-D-alanine carboxypeptidase family protein [Pseudanabaenaceae cyanobacterium bins.68]
MQPPRIPKQLPREIPLAQRVAPKGKAPNKTKRSLVQKYLPLLRLWWVYALVLAAFLAPIIVLRGRVNQRPLPLKLPTKPAIAKPIPKPIRSQKYGHFAYAEADPATLETIAIASDGYQIKLKSAAAREYRRMVAAALAAGIALEGVSGFRTRAVQSELFYEIGQARNQSEAERALVSAPPGYSEHHTGYAVDLVDLDQPSANLSPSFERTAGFLWLQQNARRYGFELSFLPNNPQGIMYEPWHWRFVGDRDSLSTFYPGK